MSYEFSALRLIDRRSDAGLRPRLNGPTALAVAGLLALAALAPPVGAQNSGKGFLFKKPVGSFSIRAGYAMANAGSDVFADATSLLTLNKSDFGAFNWGGDISYSTSARTDLVFDVDVSSSKANSEFRDWEDNNGAPIEQATKFKRIPLTIGLKYYLTDRGRSVSQFAYIPSRYAPYVNLGGGAMYYRFEQSGDFVDFKTLGVYGLTVESSGWTPMAHGAAGMDYSISNWVALTGEGRYVWAKAKLNPNDFEGYQKIDLSGFAGTVGLKVRF
jgi:hypothetical protein